MKLYFVQDENYGGYGALDGSGSWMNMPVHGDLFPNVGGDGETGAPIADDSMISNLPLLFANGYPTSLDKITLVCNLPKYKLKKNSEKLFR